MFVFLEIRVMSVVCVLAVCSEGKVLSLPGGSGFPLIFRCME